MLYRIKSSEKPNLKLCENNTIASVLQNISILLATRKGTIPMYRDFGISMEFLDRPVDVAEAIIAREVREAIDEYEPRAHFTSLSLEADGDKLAVIVEVDIDE